MLKISWKKQNKKSNKESALVYWQLMVDKEQ